MDIYKQAMELDADYYDQNTGYIYHIQEYNKARKFGFRPKIRVTLNGITIGYAKKIDEE